MNFYTSIAENYIKFFKSREEIIIFWTICLFWFISDSRKKADMLINQVLSISTIVNISEMSGEHFLSIKNL